VLATMTRRQVQSKHSTDWWLAGTVSAKSFKSLRNAKINSREFRSIFLTYEGTLKHFV
jgi:hypothetical protein